MSKSFYFEKNSPDFYHIQMVWSSLKTYLRKNLCKKQNEADQAIWEICERELTPEKNSFYIERLVPESHNIYVTLSLA